MMLQQDLNIEHSSEDFVAADNVLWLTDKQRLA